MFYFQPLGKFLKRIFTLILYNIQDINKDRKFDIYDNGMKQKPEKGNFITNKCNVYSLSEQMNLHYQLKFGKIQKMIDENTEDFSE